MPKFELRLGHFVAAREGPWQRSATNTRLGRWLSTVSSSLAMATVLSSIALASPAAPTQAAPDPATSADDVPQGAPAPAPEPLPLPLPQPLPQARPQRAAPQPGVVNRAPASANVERKQRNVHGLGIAGGMATGSGFAYRRYAGNSSLQATVWAMVLDRGDNAAVWGGLTYAHYLLVWHDDRRMSVLPDTSALRLSVSGSYLFDRTTDNTFSFVNDDPLCTTSLNFPCPGEFKDQKTTTRDHTISLGVGIGFEFGAILRPGLSVALDLQLTAIMDQESLRQIWPLPTLAVIYSW